MATFVNLILALALASMMPKGWGTNVNVPTSVRDAFSRGVGFSTTNARIQQYGAEDRLSENSSFENALYFLQNELAVGNKVQLTLFKASVRTSAGKNKFLPLNEKTLQEFSLKPKELKQMEDTIQACNSPPMNGEKKSCFTSLSSMIAFVTSNIGLDFDPIETLVTKNIYKKEYHIAAIKEKGRHSVACHPQAFVYPVYYCHVTEDTTAYAVTFVEEDGLEVDAAAICHYNTSEWNPRHVAFKVLNVKPGSVPICHLFPNGDVLWIKK